MRAVSILVGALGGEGGGVLAQWLVEAATAAGYPAQSTSIPGVAQRTGATTYYIEVFSESRAALDGREPVLSLLPVPGAVDLVVASELLEATRMAGAGMLSPDRTLLVTSTSRTLTTLEKMAPGDGRFDSDLLEEVLRRHSARCIAFDMAAAAREAGTVVSAVMFGAIAGSGLLPFSRGACEAVVGADERGAQASLRGFEAGYSATQATAPAVPATVRPAATASAASARAGRPTATGTTSPLARANRARDDADFAGGIDGTSIAGADSGSPFASFPIQVRDIVALGHARLVDFQDAAYAAVYLKRVTRLLAAERSADASAAHGYAMTREAARFLALWMAFDDVIRVAGLKCRASRSRRVRREVAAGDGDVVQVTDLFKPGVPEFAGLLSPRWSARLVAWDRRRQQRGKAPLAFALRVRSDSIGGFLALRLLASLKGWRRRGARYLREQEDIENWLAAIERAVAIEWARANELALCGRLVKGYGATNERAKRNLTHIVMHLASAPAEAIRQAREAALADEGGVALDRALVAHGAPARPAVVQPIRWMKKPGRPPTPGAR